MKIISIVGVRPNFMKIAPLHKVFQTKKNVESIIVHTGQHYERTMSNVFFQDLNLPEPKYSLNINKGSISNRLANIILKLEPIIEVEHPDLIIVVGDVTSTLGGALVANKMRIPLAHVEAGLRSHDLTMPEETNRILTDKISDFLFITEFAAKENLIKDGIKEDKIHFVGNLMIDSLVHNLECAEKIELPIDLKSYALLTMHRPSNVDNKDNLNQLIRIISMVTEYIPVVFPLHPRTKSNLERFELMDNLKKVNNLKVLSPQGYYSFLKLMKNATVVITDSGGIQEETTFLKIPCITLRNSTERPCTVDMGTNTLIPNLELERIKFTLSRILNSEYKTGKIPPFWDGKSAERVVDVLLNQI